MKVKENSFTCLQLVMYYSKEHALCFLFVPEKIKTYQNVSVLCYQFAKGE